MTYFQTTTDAIMFGLEVILSMIEILFILRLFNKVFGEARINHIKLYAAAAIAMLAITCGLRMVLNPVRPAALPPITVLCSMFFLLCYPPNRQKKVLYIGILLTVSLFWILVYDLIVTPIENKSIWLTLILSHVGFYLLLELIRKTDKGKQWSIPFHLWLLLMSITVASAAGLSVMEYYISNRDNPYLLTVEIPFSLIFLFINLSLFVVFDKFSTLIHTERENTMLEQQVQLQHRYYKELEAAHHQVRALHHDMGNYIRTAEQLAAQQDSNNELIGFLNAAAGQLKEIETVISTGNQYLDSILNIKIAEMLHEGVTVESDIHVPSSLKLSFEQAVIIVGNLMDNAREACRELQSGERWVRINLSYINHTLFIRIENSASPIQKWDNGLPVSTKNEPFFHGLGLKNVKKAVEALGTMDVESTAQSFLVRIALYDR
ncbi:sensor histidine kinase [Paenibacillus alvei]|uniref:GHKL domain-containing protein n=1 Tax=Paenibacillus alvei TaxID=44250 RepID=A0AAP7A049_PAEAL|nr:sensor histidine kinase [Paenibacillus alvei]NOJ71011.1 GHKL domain-containing protein [Paenibacillus alvei]